MLCFAVAMYLRTQAAGAAQSEITQGSRDILWSTSLQLHYAIVGLET